MKATGIVRRIDDLGRIVVPKEIRRTLRIREGDPLEIFTDREGEIILKKYSPIGELSQFAGEYAESLAHTTGYLVLITDGDHVVAASGSGKKDFEGKPISGQLEEIIGERKSLVASDDEKAFVKLTADDAGEYRQQTCRGGGRLSGQTDGTVEQNWKKAFETVCFRCLFGHMP